MTPEEIQALGMAVANLVDAKVQAGLSEMKTLARQCTDAGHAAITRAGQVEEALDRHERCIRRLWNHQFPEDEFPLRGIG